MPNDTPIDNAVCGGVIEVAAASYSYDHSSDAIRAESMVAPGTGALSEKEFLLFDGLTTVPTGVCCGGSVLQYNLRSTGNVIMESSQVLVASTMPPSSAAVGLESAAQQEVCARPSTVHITSTNPWSAALAVRRMQHQGKFNEGTICDNPAQTLEQCINDSVQFVALSPSGNSCDHVCGMIGPETTACAAPSDRRFYKVTIPARQALEINANFRTGPGLNLDGNGDIFMYDDNGTDLNCRVRNASNYYQDTPENRQARLVNNTDAPMTVVLAPRHLSFAPMYYNFAVGIHPNP
jgi:hypothetical protein